MLQNNWLLFLATTSFNFFFGGENVGKRRVHQLCTTSRCIYISGIIYENSIMDEFFSDCKTYSVVGRVSTP